MKLASFEIPTPAGQIRRVGVRHGTELVDVTNAYATVLEREGNPSPVEVAEAVAPPDMRSFLARGNPALDAAAAALSLVADEDVTTGPNDETLLYSEEEVDLVSPLPRPNSVRDCIAFEGHIRNSLGEVPDVWYEMPVYYKSNPDSTVGPGADVHWPAYTDELDYELELGIVIGKEGSDIPVEEADEYVAGYTVFNDVSARDIQMREMEVGLGPSKGKDFANVFGPVIATPDEVDISDAAMRAYVNDELWSEGTTGDMYYSVAEIVEHVSMGETIYPGDIIGSGTVTNGCGLELDKWIQPGDIVRLEIEGIGALENRVVR